MKKNILVIEDDRDNLDLLEYILADEGYNVTGYRELQRPEGILEQHPSLILLDNKVGDGFGYSLCSLLKSNELTKNIPVVLVSASGNLEQIAGRCHADAFLEKPFNLDDFLNMVKRYSDLQYVD